MLFNLGPGIREPQSTWALVSPWTFFCSITFSSKNYLKKIVRCKQNKIPTLCLLLNTWQTVGPVLPARAPNVALQSLSHADLHSLPYFKLELVFADTLLKACDSLILNSFLIIPFQLRLSSLQNLGLEKFLSWRVFFLLLLFLSFVGQTELFVILLFVLNLRGWIHYVIFYFRKFHHEIIAKSLEVFRSSCFLKSILISLCSMGCFANNTAFHKSLQETPHFVLPLFSRVALYCAWVKDRWHACYVRQYFEH